MSAEALLSQLRGHLQDLESDPSQELNERLFESCALVLPQTLSTDQSGQLIQQLSQLLPRLHANPTPAIGILVPLLHPFSFSDILAIGPGVDFVAGLNVEALPYNRLMLALLQKAATNPNDAATVATQPEVVVALVKLWLCTHDTGVASQCGQVLLGLLQVDQQTSVESAANGLPGQGQGLVWKRIFYDQDVYSLLFSICSLRSDDASTKLSKSQRTLAQARLLEWLPKVGAMDWVTITRSHHAEIESRYTNGRSEGLLLFASSCMVDIKDDVLMHRCLIDFFADLISTVRHTQGASSLQSSVSLDFLHTHKLHTQASAFYLDPRNPKHDPLDVSFLYGPSANYVAVYASTYPEHFLASPVRQQTLKQLSQTLDQSPTRWAHTESPKYDLHVLASLPRTALLPVQRGPNAWSSSPVSLLPSKSTNPDVLNTLATLFHGPARNEIITYPAGSPLTDEADAEAQSEAQMARALYFLYLNYNPRLFADLVSHADTVALKDQALAAISVLMSIITSNWLPLAEAAANSDTTTTTEADLVSWLPSPPTATPAAGVLAILAPPSLEYTLPYLLKPAQSFSNLVGGRGDAESAAYKIAVAKFDTLKTLHDRLAEFAQAEPGQGYEDILATLQKRIAEGPWSRQAEVGGRIATMDL